MKHLPLSIFFFFVALTTAPAQSFSELLASIEQHNTTLQALRQDTDAEQLATRADLALADPEVGFNYLWGNPSSIGNRQDITITQTFDAATLGGQKYRVAQSQSQALECQYRAERMALLLEAKQHLIDLTYTNAMILQLTQRVADAETLLHAQQRRLEVGDGTLLNLNAARLGHASLTARLQQLEADRQALLLQLQQLNGGQVIVYETSDYPLTALPVDFEAWYAQSSAHSPLLAEAAANVELSHRLLSLTRTQRLPALTLGYMSEKTDGEHYQGIAAGLSIPLWGSRRKIRQAKAGVAAAEARLADATLQLHAHLQGLHQRALALQSTAATFRQTITASDNTPLLRRALDAGQISLPEYLQQLTLLYDAFDQALVSERDYQQALAELTAVEL